MKTRILLAAPALFAFAAAACSAEVGQTDTTGSVAQADSCSALYGQCGGTGWTGATCCAAGSVCTYSNAYYSQCLAGSSSSSSSSSSCPNAADDAQERAAADVAFHIMQTIAAGCSNSQETGSGGGGCFAGTSLGSQRYRVASGGATIEFDPNDRMYSYVPAKAKGYLAVAQMDSTVASYLVTNLKWAQANTNGSLIPNIMGVEAFNTWAPGNTSAITICDSNAGGCAGTGGRRNETITTSSWCGTSDFHFVDNSSYMGNSPAVFTPLQAYAYSNTSQVARGFTGGSTQATSPFAGPNGTSNPYLVIATSNSGTTVTFDWSNPSTWIATSCPNDASCKATIDIDPIPYTLPTDQYNAAGSILGPQANPFSLVITNLYADPYHATQWATRTAAGVQQWGTFSNAVVSNGFTFYQYVKQM